MSPAGCMLRASLASLRAMHKAIARADLAWAFQCFSQARHDLGYACGAEYPIGPSAERVRRLIEAAEEDLYQRIRKAATPAEPVDLPGLVADIASGIEVLKTRDRFDIPRELILERARNVVGGLVGNYVVRGRS